MKWHMLISLVVGSLLLSNVVLAAEAPDEVRLHNGGMLRGTVLSVEPGDSVVIQVPGASKPRTIPWDDVAGVERGKYDDGDSSAADPDDDDEPDAEKPSADEERGMPDGQRVRVHIDADDPSVQLFRTSGVATMVGSVGGRGVTATAAFSEPICSAPCDKVIDPNAGGTYFFAGSGVTSSKEFAFTGRKGDTTIHVDSGSAGARVAGVWLTVTGAILVVPSAVLIGMGAAVDSPDEPFDTPPIFTTMGGIGLAVGGVLAAVGIPLWATSGTDFTFDGEPREDQALTLNIGPTNAALNLTF